MLAMRPSAIIAAICLGSACGALLGPPYTTLPAEPSLTATYTLNDGKQMPIMGLGVYMMKPGEETSAAVAEALRIGYRMIDTAMIYGNEESVGEGIRLSGVKREDIFLATKLWDSDHGYHRAIEAAKLSMKKLGTSYLDLYIIHSPQSGKLVETWDALLHLQHEGLVRSIGVSNYGVKHLEALEQHGRPLPAVNQVEMHPLNWKERENLLTYCKPREILVQAYGSLFFGKEQRLTEQAVGQVAAAHGKTNAQVLLRWGYQMGFQLIPKSTKAHRLKENADIFDFELSPAEMKTLGSMKGELGAYWQPLSSPVDLGDTETHKYDAFKQER
eukprot:TRINITY_DN19878_c0_g1_i1.p1 TRINITY_DN19878_c0_g1~~TRINITY_DN19878_c0_g1_i1.p1  ORF type:complete len:329 (-),score=68.39 TRINITY_DN19878_c0_g1_i1:43-1029(-)